jgi:hypothetical protein
MINNNLNKAIEEILPRVPVPRDGTSKRSYITNDLFNLNKRHKSSLVNELIAKYGMKVVIMYRLNYNQGPKGKHGSSHPDGTSSQPESGSEKINISKDYSESLYGNYRYKQGSNPFFVAYELKKQILEDAGYPDSKSRFVGYISDFKGEMNECMIRVLSEPMNRGLPGNLYTAIEKNFLNTVDQESIRSIIQTRCSRELKNDLDDEDGTLLVLSIAAEVREMILGESSDMDAAAVAELDAASA